MNPGLQRIKSFSGAIVSRILGAASNQTVLSAVLLCSLVYAWAQYAEQIKIWHALVGMSPIAWTHHYFHPEIFPGDFPNGDAVYDKISFMYVYLVAYRLFGIDPADMLPAVLAFEFALMAAAAYVLSRVISPKASAMAHVALVVMMVASFGRDVDMFDLSQPRFKAVNYNFADALRVLAVIMAARERYTLSGALLAVSFSSHPIWGLQTAFFILAVILASKPDKRKLIRAAVGGGVFIALGAAWSFAVFEPGALANTGIGRDLWVDLGKMYGVHWYPVESGYFTSHHHRFVQLISLFVLASYYLARRSAERGMIDRQMTAGMLAMLLLVCAGIIVTVVFDNPALVRLSFIRASELLVTVALVYAVHGLWSDIERGNLVQGVLAAASLLSCFYMRPGFPLLLSIMVAAPAWYGVFRGRWRENLAVAALTAGAAGLVVSYITLGAGDEPWGGGALASVRNLAIKHAGGESFLRMAAFWALTAGGAVLLARWSLRKNPAPLIVLLMALFSQQNVLTGLKMDQRNTARAQDFMEAQVWANENTPADALFMVDPSLWSGWRDFSLRSSFGNTLEWIILSSLYMSDKNTFDEGVRRLGEFGINLDDYIKMKSGEIRFRLLTAEARNRYYSFGDSWRLDLAERYGIDYFVMQRDRITTPPGLPAAYQNDSFVVYSARRAPAG